MSFKRHLLKIAGQVTIRSEEIYALTQIEALLNSRPLNTLPEDANDLECLTPAHFLVGEKLTDLAPKANYEDIPQTNIQLHNFHEAKL